MTTKTISGTITGGYTLSPAYDALSITSTGAIFGSAGANGGHRGKVGGVGVELPLGGAVTNDGSIAGGRGGSANRKGGAGGVAMEFAASGTVDNDGSITGGFGGRGGNGISSTGGAGGAGVALASGGAVVNGGLIAGGYGAFGGRLCGDGGAGVRLGSVGEISNTGTISGGHGGGMVGYKYGSPAGVGGVGVQLAKGGTITNNGLIEGGAGGYVYGAYGAGGVGILLSAGGMITNNGLIEGGAAPGGDRGGSKGGTAILLAAGGEVVNRGTIEGGYGAVYWGDGVVAGASGAATVTNYGMIEGSLNLNLRNQTPVVVFRNAADRLIIEAGSTLIGQVEGGGGTLELAAGADSGSQATFSNFGTCQFDAGSTLDVSTSGAFKYKPTIVGFAAGDTIDLTKVSFVGNVSVNARDQLLIVEGSGAVARFQLSGDYVGATFETTGDGNGGTDVTLVADAPSPHVFAAAMAGLGKACGSTLAMPAHVQMSRDTLLAPRSQMA